MKRIIALGLCLLMVVGGLAGCGEKKSEEENLYGIKLEEGVEYRFEPAKQVMDSLMPDGTKMRETLEYQYDSKGNLTKYISSKTIDGKTEILETVTNEYDADGNRTKQSVVNSENLEYSSEVTWEYDAQGNVVRTDDGEGHITEMTYEGNLCVLEKYYSIWGRKETTYTYYPSGEKKEMTEKSESSDGEEKPSVTKIEYYENGNIRLEQESAGELLLSKTVGQENGSFEKYYYSDGEECLVSKKEVTNEPDGTSHIVEEDEYSKKEYVERADGRLIWSKEWDEDGNLKESNELQYDNNGNVIFWKQNSGVESITTFERNDAGDVLKESVEENGVIVQSLEHTYDENHNQLRVVGHMMGDGYFMPAKEFAIEMKLEYDAGGNCVLERIWADGDLTMETQYDRFGNQLNHWEKQTGEDAMVSEQTLTYTYHAFPKEAEE